MVNNTMPTVGIGTHYPNRIFVGSLPGRASATDLAEFFKKFGTVLEGKVVLDTNGNSRRFGFITFATNEDVKRVLAHGVIFFRGKQISVGPAVKRMIPDNQPSIVWSQTDGASGSNMPATRNQVCELLPLPDTLTPPGSPISPMNGQRVFFRMDKVSPKSLPLPSMQYSVPQPYVFTSAGLPIQTTVTSLHIPYQDSSQIAPPQLYSISRYPISPTPVKHAVPFQNSKQFFPCPTMNVSTRVIANTSTTFEHR